MSAESEYGAAEFLCFEVIRQMENRGREVPETSFNKLCSLVHQEVSNEHEVDLPLKWYQYGNVVDLRFLNADFLRHESGDWGLGEQESLLTTLQVAPSNYLQIPVKRLQMQLKAWRINSNTPTPLRRSRTFHMRPRRRMNSSL